MQQRLMFRNFFHLYHRSCDKTGKRIISMYQEDAPFPVYDMHEWWGDGWDGLSYGIDINASQSVFDQISILHSTVPRMNITNTQCENTDYCNMSFLSKNCYLIGGNVRNEDCCYGHIVWRSSDCYDNLYIYQCERCYECIDCFECYNLAFSRGCENCNESRFLVHCNACNNCFGCVGLKNKQYCMFNQQLTKDEYEQRLNEFKQGSHSMIALAKERLHQLIGNEIVKHYHGNNCEDCTGDYLYNCKNVLHSFDAKNCEDCKYLATAESFTNCYDGNFTGIANEWSYNVLTSDGNQLLMCSNVMNASADMIYCQDCYACKNCFGCVGLKGKQYCIFNKSYTKEQYENLVPQLIELMQADGTWGTFFPMNISPFAYNESMAHEYFPLRKEEVQAKGLRWKEDDQQENYLGPDYKLPDNSADIPEDICEKILRCAKSGKPYKLIPQEVAFLQEMNLPIPQLSFLERHKQRMKVRNPRKLWQRTCQKCQKSIQTTYHEQRPEQVYCEECYFNEVY